VSDGAEVEIIHYSDNAVASLCGAEYPHLKSSGHLSEVNCFDCLDQRLVLNMASDKALTPRPFQELFDSGLLWLINAQVFHPRGYALQIHLETDGDTHIEAVGWSIIGDGLEAFQIGCDDESQEKLQRRFDQIRDLLP
jgi:hypothetical protein